jgi:hypothetical protein
MASSTKTNHQQRAEAAVAPTSRGDRTQAAPALIENRDLTKRYERTLALGGSRTDRWIGMWSARVLFALGVSYAVIMIIGLPKWGTPANRSVTPTWPSWRFSSSSRHASWCCWPLPFMPARPKVPGRTV